MLLPFWFVLAGLGPWFSHWFSQKMLCSTASRGQLSLSERPDGPPRKPELKRLISCKTAWYPSCWRALAILERVGTCTAELSPISRRRQCDDPSSALGPNDGAEVSRSMMSTSIGTQSSGPVGSGGGGVTVCLRPSAHSSSQSDRAELEAATRATEASWTHGRLLVGLRSGTRVALSTPEQLSSKPTGEGEK